MDKARKNIEEITNALQLTSQEHGTEFKFRLNIENHSISDSSSYEEEIWAGIRAYKKRIERKAYLRELFIYGYWFELLPSKELATIELLFSNTINITTPEPNETKPTNTAKKKLGDLMPCYQ